MLGGRNANGARRRTCLSTFRSSFAISAKDRTRPTARSSIQARALATAKRDERVYTTYSYIGIYLRFASL
jgi:hypothetical protein